MPPIIIACPQCAMQLRVPDTITPGTKVKCPQCAATFETPAVDAGPPPTPFQAAATYDVMPPPPVPRSAPPETYEPADSPHYRRSGWESDRFADVDETGAAYRRQHGIDDLSNDYTIDLGALFAQAQNHWGEVVGPMIGYGIVFALIGIVCQVVPLIGPLAWAAIGAPLQAGFIIVALAQLRGRSWSFGDFFSGFNWWVAIWVSNLLVALAAFACVVPGLIMLAAVGDSKNRGLIAIAMILLIGGVIAMLYIVIRASFFATALIVERNCGPVEALQGSWRLTEGHFWGWFGVSVVLGLINMAGAFLCGVGLLLSAPFVVLVTAAAYLAVAGPRRPAETL